MRSFGMPGPDASSPDGAEVVPVQVEADPQSLVELAEQVRALVAQAVRAGWADAMADVIDDPSAGG